MGPKVSIIHRLHCTYIYILYYANRCSLFLANISIYMFILFDVGSKSNDGIFPGLLLHLGGHDSVCDQRGTGVRPSRSIDRVQDQPQQPANFTLCPRWITK